MKNALLWATLLLSVSIGCTTKTSCPKIFTTSQSEGFIGNVKEVKEFYNYFNENKTDTLSYIFYKFDNSGYEIYYVTVENGDTVDVSNTIIILDENGCEDTVITNIARADDYIEHFSYKIYYDKKRNVIVYKVFEDGILTQIHYNYFNTDNNLIKRTMSGSEGKEDFYINYTHYNIAGKPAGSATYANNEKLDSTTIFYKADNTRIELKTKTNTYEEYDNKNNIIAFGNFINNKYSPTTRYQYQFDAQGNWTTQTKYEDSTIVQVVKRSISYYD